MPKEKTPGEKQDNDLGLIIRGSLVEGLEMKLNPEREIEQVSAGKFVVVHGNRNRFFSLITDVRLDSTSSNILTNPPESTEEVLRSVLFGTSTYGTVELRPMLMTPLNGDEPKPVRTVPPHFAEVKNAEEADVSTIFGSEKDDNKYFQIGTPIDMATPVCLNLDRFVERSNGIFGKSGTGKTFLTRLVLAGVINKDTAVNLIFDMHNEYGWASTTEGHTGTVKGLQQLFDKNKVAIFSLDPSSSRQRGITPDVEVYISLDQIEIEDIALLQNELNLNTTAFESAFSLLRAYGDNWLSEFLSWDNVDKEQAQELGAHLGSLQALHRKLMLLKKLPFVDTGSINDKHRKKAKGAAKSKAEGTIAKIIEYLNAGRNVVLEFGRQKSDLAYLLVANIISRRIHEHYVNQTEKYLSSQNPADEPKQLMITIEEAHKFLNPQTAKQTIFGTIARELRKYSVTLLIVDQRPSGIDDEVMSQIGTRISALLNDEKDIQAVFTGVPNTSGLRSILASLDSKQQALLLGHALPMPISVRTRDYDEAFYKAMSTEIRNPKKDKKFIDSGAYD